jgi:hypothetical protein
MTRSFLCYRLLRVARHPRCSGEDLPQPVHLPRGRHRLQQESGRLRVQSSSVRPHSHIQVSLPALLTHKRVRGTGHRGAMGISTWRAGAAALWIASIENTVASTYNFAFLTRSFTCLSGRLRITTRRQAGIRLRQCPL